MNDQEPEIRQAVEEWMAETGPAGWEGGEHPDAEMLAAYHARELPAAAEQRLQEHLLLCRECAGLLLDLEELDDPDFGHEIEVPEGTGEALWDGLRQEIRREPAPAAATVIPFPIRRTSAPPPWMSALAAALLVAVVGLSVWVASLRRTVGELSRPEINAPVLDLVPSGIGQREGGPAPAAVVPSGSRSFTLILSPGRRGDFQDYEAEIARAGGEVIWRGRGLRPNDYGSFSLTLSRRALGAGKHRLRLFGIRSDRREALGEYGLQIAP
ncbi:MAG TPA: zf-HC2 domain-containing protein [Thermoanaerobaculia bacterium]|nr:zf-HC2 domain-containing protein [Thermoanaerobaculia bacterium]